MRKFGIIVVLSLLVSVGCDRPAPIEGPREISFSSQYNRSLIEDVEDLQKENVKVFGSCTFNNKTVTQFDGTRLYYDAELPGWNYDDKQYWISKAVYNFYAIAPYEAAECTFSAEDGTVTISNYESGSGLNDLLYAATTRDLTDRDDFSAVPLVFRHACSAVRFNLTNASNATVTDVRNVRLVGLQNRGDFTLKADGTASWVLDGSTVSDTNIFGGGCTLPNGGLTVNINYKHSLYDYGSILVLPQSVYKTPTTLHLEYIKQGDSEYAIRDIELGMLGGSTPTEWKAGEAYEYNMTITDNTISADVKVVDWIEHNVEL
jgi:hypothetical protein